MLLEAPSRHPVQSKARTFSHPELNCLRFLAFSLVFVDHAQSVHWVARYTAIGAFGVPIFFLLSAYLIVSLLLREKEATGTINLRYFALRRVLRIWPLYLVALLGGFCIGRVRHDLLMPRGMLAAFTFFAGNVYVARHGWTNSPDSILWSISIEEQFYLVIPVIAKFGSPRTMRYACWATLIISYATLLYFFGIHSADPENETTWVNSAVCFQFFAIGGLIAFYTQAKRFDIPLYVRCTLFVAGMMSFAVAGGHTRIIHAVPNPLYFCMSYAFAALGSCLMFFSFFGYPAKRRSIPAYLGVISYGLYVFHPWVLEFVVEWADKTKTVKHHTNVIVDILALLLTIVVAMLSFEYFEKPILNLKGKFEVVRSQPM